MKKNSITDYYFCEDCETYHHPNRKIGPEYLAACECEVLTQGDDTNLNSLSQHDSSFFKLSAESKNIRHSNTQFQRSGRIGQRLNINDNIWAQQLHQKNIQNNQVLHRISSADNIQSISNKVSRESLNSINQRSTVKQQRSPIYRSHVLQNRPTFKNRILSPIIQTRRLSPPLQTIIEQPQKQSRIPWPIKNNRQTLMNTLSNKSVKRISDIKIPPPSVLNRISINKPTQAIGKGSLLRQQSEQFKNSYLSTFDSSTRQQISFDQDEPECCGKLCYF